MRGKKRKCKAKGRRTAGNKRWKWKERKVVSKESFGLVNARLFLWLCLTVRHLVSLTANTSISVAKWTYKEKCARKMWNFIPPCYSLYNLYILSFKIQASTHAWLVPWRELMEKCDTSYLDFFGNKVAMNHSSFTSRQISMIFYLSLSRLKLISSAVPKERPAFLWAFEGQ